MADPHSSVPAADHADAYVHGSQEITEQTSTLHLFQGLAKWGSFAVALAIAVLTVWFMPKGGFMAAVGVGVVMGVVGVLFLRERPKAH